MSCLSRVPAAGAAGARVSVERIQREVWVDETGSSVHVEDASLYNWVRVRLFGGRSLFWSRQSFRLSDYEFKAKSHDGFGEDWPIGHADLAPYYSRVEGIFCVRARWMGRRRCRTAISFSMTHPWSPAMQRFIGCGQATGMPVCKQRRALGRDGLASSVNLLLPDAEKTGKLTSIANAVVREMTVDKNTGLPNGCNFVDRLSHREMSVKARVVVLAAGTLESTRLLLNSKLANSSGLVGRYLMDQIYGAGVVCSVPEARNGKSKGVMGSARSFRDSGISIRRAPSFCADMHSTRPARPGALGPRNFAAYGESCRDKMDEYYGSGFHMTIMGEVLGRYENHVRSIRTATMRGGFRSCTWTRSTPITNSTWRRMP